MGASYGTFYKKYLFISFAPAKETNQRKTGRKRQPHPVCTLATHSLCGATKQDEVRTFSGLPTHISNGIIYDIQPLKEQILNQNIQLDSACL